MKGNERSVIYGKLKNTIKINTVQRATKLTISAVTFVTLSFQNINKQQ